MIGELDRTFRPEHGARAAKIAVSLSNYVEWGQSHPELLQLDSLGHGVLERNLGAETLVAFKQALQERLTSGASILEVAFGLQPGRGLQLLTRTYAMTRGSWQSFDHSQHPPGQPLNPFGRSFATERLDALSECRRDALA